MTGNNAVNRSNLAPGNVSSHHGHSSDLGKLKQRERRAASPHSTITHQNKTNTRGGAVSGTGFTRSELAH